MSKKILTLIIILLLIFSSTGLVLILASQNNDPAKFILVKELGNVMYKADSTDEYIELLDAEIELSSGSFIRTGEDSYARIFLADNSLISLDQDTEIQVVIDKGSSVAIDQLLGNTWHRVQTVLNGNEYKVNTMNTIAAVRGTIFGVNVLNDETSEVFVIDSLVDVSAHENGSVIDTVGVQPGELANVLPDNNSIKITIKTIPEELKDSYWYKRNMMVDDVWQKLPGKGNRFMQKVFQELLLQQLHKSDMDSVYNFGLTPPNDIDEDDLNSQIEKVQDITKVTEETCTIYSLNDFQSAIDTVYTYRDYIANYNEIVNLLYKLKNSCTDGILSLLEVEDIRAEVNTINAD